MSQFHTIFSNNATMLHFENFGVSVTYTDAGGTETTLTAIAGADRMDPERQGSDGRNMIRERTFKIGTSAAMIASTYSGIADPLVNATITYDGDEWSIVRVENTNVGLAILHCEIREVIERSRSGYRRVQA